MLSLHRGYQHVLITSLTFLQLSIHSVTHSLTHSVQLFLNGQCILLSHGLYTSTFLTWMVLSLRSHITHPSLPSGIVLNVPFSVRLSLVTPCPHVPYVLFLLDFAKNNLSPSNIYVFISLTFFFLSLPMVECKLFWRQTFWVILLMAVFLVSTTESGTQ